MGACLCCLPRPLALNPDSSSDRRSSFSFLSCCGMYEALLQPSDENDRRTLSTHNDSCAENVERNEAATTSGSSVQVADGNDGNCGTPAKVSIDLVQPADDGSRSRDREAGCVLIGHSSKVIAYNEEKKPLDDLRKVHLLNKNDEDFASSVAIDEDDICPICLDGYDFENPKLTTKCGHCFHLSCILEWMERSSHCAICYQEMAFDGSL